jgi:hypothetical protein
MASRKTRRPSKQSSAAAVADTSVNLRRSWLWLDSRCGSQLQVFEQFHRELWRRHHVHPPIRSWSPSRRTGVQPGLLATALAVKRPNMTKLLDTLERRGWIERHQQSQTGAA